MELALLFGPRKARVARRSRAALAIRALEALNAAERIVRDLLIFVVVMTLRRGARGDHLAHAERCEEFR